MTEFFRSTSEQPKQFWTPTRIMYAFLGGFVLVIVLVGYWHCAGCGQRMARSYGGTYTVNLDSRQKLTHATWKDDELWYLTRPMRLDEAPEEWTFQQRKIGVGLEGTVVFREQR